MVCLLKHHKPAELILCSADQKPTKLFMCSCNNNGNTKNNKK